MRIRLAAWGTALLAAALLAGCPDDGGSSGTNDDVMADAGTDTGATGDTGTPDTGGTDIGGTDTGTDTGADTGTDTGADIADDAGADVGTDIAPTDPNCADYCSAVQAACTGANSQYPSIEECLDYCGTIAFFPIGTADDTSGNTIGCRTYHATVAAQPGNADTHCAHAGPTGGDVCGSWCDNYCALATKNCAGANALYATEAECGTACAAFSTDGDVGATDGSSVQCRIYHLGVAGTNPPDSNATHCPHGAPDGGGVCVDPGPTDPTCDAYCDAVTAACTGDNAQYGSKADCMAYCGQQGKLPLGTVDDTSGNTVGCRTYHATVAAMPGNAAAHCPHAGPSGGDVCGTWCENYCHLATGNCTGGDAIYTSAAECSTACTALDPDGAPGATDGDSVQCRIYHLGVAGQGGAAATTHCPHGAPDGGGVCVEPGPTDPTCADYCATVTAACTGDNAQYASEAACMTYCTTQGKLPLGALADTDGNTVGCRIYHATVAAQPGNAAAHCPHAGPTGGNVCGTWCTNYCHLATSNCTGGNAIYDNEDKCLEACVSLDANGAPGDADGDSLQCRIYHLGVAGTDATAAATHCPHGAEDGGGVCVEPDPVPTCEEYCTTIQAACTGANSQYGSEVECITYCQDWAQVPVGTYDDVTGNTVGCRLYHATVAGMPGNADAHCAHAGPSGGDVCGSWCENYCHLSGTNCTGGNALYGDDAACMTGCAALASDGSPNAIDGDSVQCRIYHLGVAGSNPPSSGATHCPHGGPDGGGVCAEPAPTCADYCAVVSAACTGDDAQYASEAACIAYCTTAASMPAGSSADTSGNTIGCRQYHATVAGMPGNAATHCPHAGPSGGDVCGSWCDTYCQLSLANCTGANAVYASDAECQTACAALSADGAAGDAGGDSVQCRIYHLGVAGSNKPDSANTHCPHTAPDGGGVCVDPAPTCAEYCAAVTSACTGDNAQYATEAACLSYCGTWAMIPAGKTGDTSGDSIGCRLYHAGVAGMAGNAATHCPHAGPTGGGVCGTLCDNYCQLAMTNCTGGNALYGSDAACMTACSAYDADGAPGDADGDTVQCRIYHLGVAGSNLPDSAVTHCPHGGTDGGGVCIDPLGPTPTCADYCTAVMGSCTGDNAQFATEAACLAYCGTWAMIPAGTTADKSGNTLGCRIYHATVAGQAGNAATHCPHAGPSGGDVCGSYCDNYCHLAGTNCTGGNALFASNAACMTACSAYDADGAPGDADGDTVQCRIYHLGVAGSNLPDSANTHCPHGGIDGASVCVDPVAPAPTCAEYCTAVTSACTAGNAQYANEAACLSYCETWAMIPAGTTADTGGNTIGCRLYHAGVAGMAGNAATHCPHAGPSGGDVCGSWCDNYCQLAMTNCTGGNELYASVSACQTTCTSLHQDGAPGDTDGDTVQCRIYHLGVAGSDMPTSAATHCPHGALDGGGVCVDPAPTEPTCADYCTAVTSACTGGNAQYADYNACMAYCGTAGMLPIGTLADTGGNTVGCRLYHATVAGMAGNAATHCPHAGPTGGDVCGSWCDNYCHLAMTNCTGGNALYTGTADCEMTCAQFAVTGDPGDADGDTIQCRLYHLGVAGSNLPASATTHCPHGAYDGGGVCVDPEPTTVWADVQPIFQGYCGGCHTGGGSGGHNIGTSYTDSQKASYLCSGKTKGECALVQIQSGYMPLGKGCSGNPTTDAAKPACTTAADQAAIQAWINDGQLP